jgi:hypothetical protein|tara:strand:+ start:926 stop:1393 length:468 start_codon:yes stop_codon:yes gene_type:complete
MMWKYRIFILPNTDPGNVYNKPIYEVREVLYSKEGMPIAYSEEVVSPFGFDVDDVQNNLILMLSDVNEGMLNSQIYKREDFEPGGNYYGNFLEYEKTLMDTFTLNKDKAEEIFDVTIDLDKGLENISITPNKPNTDNVVDLATYKKDKDDDGTRH